MTAVVSRVLSASLSVGGELVSEIEKGLLIYVGCEAGDSEADAAKLAHKCAGLRIFSDAEGKMNLNACAVGGKILAVSNFTLAGDCKKGFRPSFIAAERPEKANPLIDSFAAKMREEGVEVLQGVFGADMQIANVADGPVTLVINSRIL